MTITTYYATRSHGHANRDADAIVHFVNDATSETGDNRSWDATRACLDSQADADTQQRYGLHIATEQYELESADE